MSLLRGSNFATWTQGILPLRGILGDPQLTLVDRAAKDRFQPKCMYRLLFASAQSYVLRKSQICIRPVHRLLNAVALLGVRTRLCLITYQTIDGHLGCQTLGASLFRSIRVRFTNIVGCIGPIKPQLASLFPSSQNSSRS